MLDKILRRKIGEIVEEILKRLGEKIGEKKGWRMIGCEMKGYNIG